MGMARYLSQLLNSSGVVNHSKMPTGSVLQVVNSTYSTLVTTTNSTFVDTGLTASITPKFSTSKILILIDHNGCHNDSSTSDVGMRIALLRNGSSIFSIDGLGPYLGNYVSGGLWGIGSISTNYLDSPSTTSALTYKTQFANRGVGTNGKVGINIGGASSTSSTITLMEIAQ